ncbi:hypothetical protein SELMODRAFT_167352 [Selaginella moellendorffii]|uniref:Post-GPI attachment to proteins factor 3 n=1 Tax=Selaginella moellendorffii TaxID=88036 RepID=D8R2M7_SELML|nr:post-GPI attachment to proteins factor 3 [Selaginella moellendorffii]EFJ33756.1 hypothetical protein SELMODRAFT_167352 [Selaginella moellendorffii]|eukprot:XP_002964918.1 post-GPI attachment to proteins factor 3 [Selaginella moellendorffii]
MADRAWPPLFVIAVEILLLALFCGASAGDRDPSYRDCVESCQSSGCIGDLCFSSCNASTFSGKKEEEPIYLSITRWDCPSECRYQCMTRREDERALAGGKPVKYHGKWPFDRIYGVQEPAAVFFSLLNLFAHVWGLGSFLSTVYYELPRGRKGPYYEFVGLWTVYGLLSIHSWFWSVVFHTRDTPVHESWDYSSAVATLGFSLILAITRTLSIKTEAARVMVSAPCIGFIATHICYLNFYEFDYGWNMIVCVVMGLSQLLFWLVWAIVSKHPSRLKVWTVGLGTLGAMLLELYDFPPLGGQFDAHSLWHLGTIPLTFLWWSFVKDDAVARTSRLVKRNQTVKKVE